MRIYSPLFLLGALGVLSAASAAAAPDTSAWKCESCPYPKGTTGTVEVGVGTVSDDSAKFGDYTGLDNDGAYLLLGGDVSHRGESGYFADLSATDLGIDARTFEAKAGREGLYSLRLGYGEIPRHFADDAMTPFLGNGGNVLDAAELPGFPSDTTGAMPLSTTLQPVELGYSERASTWAANGSPARTGASLSTCARTGAKARGPCTDPSSRPHRNSPRPWTTRPTSSSCPRTTAVASCR